MPYYKEIEWELLQDEKIFENNNWIFEFPFEMPRITQLTFKRDEFYNISIEIICKSNEIIPNEIKKAIIIDYINITSKYSQKEYLVKNASILQYGTSIENDEKTIYIHLSTTKILFNLKNNDETSWIKEWYLNGPKSRIIFHRSTTFSKKEIFEKKLDNSIPELRAGNNFQIEIPKNENITRNYMFCKLNDKDNIIINAVPDTMNPSWSNNICISYNSKEIIDNKDLRGNIDNIISFIFGRKLIKIGESHYNSKGIKIKEEIFNPYINNRFNLKNICESSDNFPIPLYNYNREQIESIISNLINSFISKNDTLNFTSMFINYWSSTYLPPESKVILLAASLESIMNKWFESKNSKRKTRIIEKSEYKKLIKDIKPKFKEKFGYCKLIMDNFYQLNRLSINKSFERFFEEIGMEIGDVEKEAIKSRNNPVHGNDLDNETFCNLIIYSHIYHTLLNRVILILLDYNREYTITNLIPPIQVSNKIPYTIEKLRDEVFKIRYFNTD
ncbi:MAG: hypothetical protein E7Z80_07970 [Methanobrevibacter thaueri]|nr:hypothetical protein [Methanobrevibacter thaueri]